MSQVQGSHFWISNEISGRQQCFLEPNAGSDADEYHVPNKQDQLSKPNNHSPELASVCSKGHYLHGRDTMGVRSAGLDDDYS